MNPKSHNLTTPLIPYAEKTIEDWSENTIRWLTSYQGNPYQAEIKNIGDVKAFIVRKAKGMWWCNTAFGLSDDDSDSVESVIRFYRESRLPYHFQFIPDLLNERLAKVLHECNMYSSGSSMILYRYIQDEKHDIPAQVTIKDVDSAEDVNTFVDVYLQGYEQRHDDDIREEMRHLYCNTKLELSMAYVDNTPAAIGVFFISENADCRVGYFGGAATIPAFRRRGCQTALIRHRLRRAAEADCAFAIVATGLGTPSEHHLEIEGFRVLRTKVVWTDADRSCQPPIRQ